ncbi:MAG: hypothetical protein ABIP27_16705 [Flavobacterium circumlabens]|uniref:hypothetical protein n=1 Tax=Flavobacterium circumlabens TaxID=2133765 RepID=UPI0032648B43
MKKVIPFLALTILAACSNDETIKEVIKEVPVEVIKEVPVIVDNTAPSTLVKTESWLKSHNNGYSSVNAANILKVEIKKCLDEGNNYQFFNIYVGDHRHDKNDVAGVAGYGNPNTVIVVFFKNNKSQEIRVYQPDGQNIRYTDYLTVKQTNYSFVDDFFKNELIGSISTGDFLKL